MHPRPSIGIREGIGSLALRVPPMLYGSNMKLVHQILAAIYILGASEVQGVAADLGLDAAGQSMVNEIDIITNNKLQLRCE